MVAMIQNRWHRTSAPLGTPMPYWRGRRELRAVRERWAATMRERSRDHASPMAMGRRPPSGLGSATRREVIQGVAEPHWPARMRLNTERLASCSRVSDSARCRMRSQAQPDMAPVLPLGRPRMPSLMSSIERRSGPPLSVGTGTLGEGIESARMAGGCRRRRVARWRPSKREKVSRAGGSPMESRVRVAAPHLPNSTSL